MIMDKIIHKTFFGQLKIHSFNNYPFCDLFYIKPSYRGRGYGHKLANLLPDKIWLAAWPLKGSPLTIDQLRSFYRKCGFRFYYCKPRNFYYGFKGFRPTQKFWRKLLKT